MRHVADLYDRISTLLTFHKILAMLVCLLFSKGIYLVRIWGLYNELNIKCRYE